MQRVLFFSLILLPCHFTLQQSNAQSLEFENLASWESAGVVRAVALAENIAIIGSDEEVISLNISELTQPEEISRVQVPRWNNHGDAQPATIMDLAIHDSHVYAIDKQATVHSFHIDESGVLTLTDSFEQSTPYIGEHVSIENGLLYASSHLAGFGGIDIFNLENPATPKLELNFGSFSRDAVIFGSLICNVTYNTGIYFWNTTLEPPFSPAFAGSIGSSTVEVVTGAEKGEGQLFLIGSSFSILQLNAANPRQSELLSQIPLPALSLGTNDNAYQEWSRDLTYADNYVYISDEAGIFVFDVLDPASPTERLFFKTDAWVDDIAVQGDIVFAANREAGLTVYKVVTRTEAETEAAMELPPHFQVSAPYPNPFQEVIHLSYSMPAASPIVIKLFDALGREIDTIFERVSPAGLNQLEWPATDLPNGIYFVQFNFGSQVETRMVSRIK